MKSLAAHSIQYEKRSKRLCIFIAILNYISLPQYGGKCGEDVWYELVFIYLNLEERRALTDMNLIRQFAVNFASDGGPNMEML